MLIHLTRSKLFTVDPAVRFGKEHNVSPEIWTEMWRRHSILGYSPKELCDYYFLRVGRVPTSKSLKRWIIRSEIYVLAAHAMKMGVEVVDSAYFKKHEPEVLAELSRNMRFSGTSDSRIFI